MSKPQLVVSVEETQAVVNIYTKRTSKNAMERFKFVTQIPITLYQVT